MSDDEDLGEICAGLVYRRTWVFLLSLGFFLYGFYNSLYFLLVSYMFTFKMEPSSCYGPGCDAMLTCDGNREASYHFRVCVMTIGSLVFGVIGMNACYNKFAVEMFQFACWLVVVAVMSFTVWAMDEVYQTVCNDHYSYNLIMEMVLWPIAGLPLGKRIQYEIRQLKTYPAQYVDSLCFHNIGLWFGIITALRVLWWMFQAYQAFMLSQRFYYGKAGMGATFSLESWQQRLKLRYEVNELGYNTFDMAMNTGMDLGWTEDEFKLQRPLRPQHLYRGARPGMMGPGMMPGMMPGGGISVSVPASVGMAYDGFQDDRRNVLL